MVKTYKGCFAAVFIFIDFLVLLLCYHITQAPVLYYILAVIILLSSIFYIVYKLRPDRDFSRTAAIWYQIIGLWYPAGSLCREILSGDESVPAF